MPSKSRPPAELYRPLIFDETMATAHIPHAQRSIYFVYKPSLLRTEREPTSPSCVLATAHKPARTLCLNHRPPRTSSPSRSRPVKNASKPAQPSRRTPSLPRPSFLSPSVTTRLYYQRLCPWSLAVPDFRRFSSWTISSPVQFTSFLSRASSALCPP